VSKETIDTITLYLNLFLVLLNVVALFVAAWQLRAARSGASAGAYITLSESLRQAWGQFFDASDEQRKQYAFSDVINSLETACAIFEDKVFVGKVGLLLEAYLCHVLILIQDDTDAKVRIERMILTDRTFEHIVKFLQEHRTRISGIRLPVPQSNAPKPA
jgi:hypothetical protein